MSKIIAIDLGSTLSEVSVLENGQPTILVNSEGSRTTPSIISFVNGERKVGAAAQRQALMNPKDTVVLIKRFMGCTYDECQGDIKHVQYEVVNENGYPRILIGDKKYSPEELSAMILTEMKSTAEAYLGETVTDAIITVPAYFNAAQRKATQDAGKIAGLNVLRVIAEPTAAILASGIDIKKGGKYMVVDYGGATLDFSVADVADDVVEILANDGDVYCGGSDIDKLVTTYLADLFNKENNCDVTKDSMAMTRIKDAAEQAKKTLSNSTTADINLPYLMPINGTPAHLITTLTKAKFESIIDDEIKKVISKGRSAVSKSGLTYKDLDGILLVGGSTRIPYLQEQLSKEFGVELIKTANPDEAVALGAAVQAGVLAGDVKDVVLLDVTPLNLGIDTMGSVMATIIDANTTIPAKRSQIFTTAVDNQPGVDIVVVQGNRPMTKDNKQIGTFHLDGIAPAPRGVPQIEVTFDINTDGILSVTAVDKATGKEQHITIENNGGLTDADIARMKAEADEHKVEDDKKKAEIDKMNQADGMAYSIEKLLNDESMSDKITEEEKSTIKPLCEAVHTAVSEKDMDKVSAAEKSLTDAWTPIATKMYQSQQDAQTTPMGDMFGGSDENPFTSGGFQTNDKPFGM